MQRDPLDTLLRRFGENLVLVVAIAAVCGVVLLAGAR